MRFSIVTPEFANLPRTRAPSTEVELSCWQTFTDEMGFGPLAAKLDQPRDCEQTYIGRFNLGGLPHPAFLRALVTVTYHEGAVEIEGTTISEVGTEQTVFPRRYTASSEAPKYFAECIKMVDNHLLATPRVKLTEKMVHRPLALEEYRFIRDVSNNWHAVHEPATLTKFKDGSTVVYIADKPTTLAANYTFGKVVELLAGRIDFLIGDRVFEEEDKDEW